jgi:exodeoxyribonuclease VIII
MLDIETNGKSAGCGILSIALVPFSQSKGVFSSAAFYSKIKPESNDELLLTPHPETMKWWHEQEIAAYDEAWSGKDDLIQTLHKIVDYFVEMESEGPVYVWGNGSDFDQPILQEAFIRAKLPVPWDFRNNRCYRTLKNLFPYVSAQEFKGVKHNALSDACHQAEHCIALLNWSERCRKL